MAMDERFPTHRDRRGQFARVGLMAAVLLGLYLTSRSNYLLFHTLAEGFAISVALWVFIIGWHARRFQENGYLAFVGIAYFFVAVVDTIHTLSYKGMGIIPGYDADLPTKLWIAARYFQSLSLLAAPFFLGRRLRYYLAFGLFSAVTGVLVWSVFTPGVFPSCYVEGAGLTRFKIVSEYVISLLLLAAMATLVWRRRDFDKTVLGWLLLSLGLTAVSELAFTAYASVYGAANMVGHLLRIVSLYFMYKAIVETGLVRPYHLLFRELKKSEQSLKADNETMQRLQRELAERNRQLQKADDLKNELLGTAAHDLRSPLTVITWYSGYLLEEESGCLTAEQRTYLEAIEKSAGYMASLVDDLLDIAQIEAGRLRLTTESTDLDTFLEGVVRLNRVLAEKKGVALRYEGETGMPAAVVDPRRLEQALNNLIGNAVKFSGRGETVTVRLSRDTDAVITVSDQGPGIPPEELDKVFKPFEKGAAAPTSEEKSTGLGLAIARKVVEEHGGSIGVESSVGRGSVFTVRLPLDGGKSAPA